MIKSKESDNMLELEENTRLLQQLKEKTKELGESLWHSWVRKAITRIRKEDNGRELLEWQ